MNTSRRITMDGPKNLRDLGGMVTTDGRTIKEGALFRSDRLFSLSENDVDRLVSKNLCCIYDFRNTNEQEQQPDVKIPGCEYISLPVFPDRKEGITHEKQTQLQGYIRFVETALKNKGQSRRRMTDSYRAFVNEEHCRKQYRSFLEDLLSRETKARAEERKQAYLWHCAGGKDRAGFASVILEEVLWINREDVIEDYMLTNQYMDSKLSTLPPHLNEPMKEYFGDRIEEIAESIRDSVEDMVLARREYIDASYEEAEKQYGSFTGFLSEGLGFSAEKQEELRKLFLE